MKIDKKDPLHWLNLVAFFACALLGLLARRSFRRGDARPVILYGHKLNGNLLALYQHMTTDEHLTLEPVFLTMDRAYARLLRHHGFNSQWTAGPGGVRLLANAAGLVSDHGLHSLQILQNRYQRAGMRFFDVWHGIPFKGFDADDFRPQHAYDEIWVASELSRNLYIDRFGFEPARVVATGYARTDRLVKPAESNAALRRRMGLPENGPLILFAPTWEQDTQGRSLYPFGQSEADFLGALSALGQRHGATCILRTHINSGDSAGRDYPNVIRLPGSTHPDTESILLVSDMMICDWSSIAFDYLLLNRPTLFLDVPPPFRKGFSLGPEYRFGAIIPDFGSLLATMKEYLLSPARYRDAFGERQRQIRELVYGRHADGNAAQRCVDRIERHQLNSESSR